MRFQASLRFHHIATRDSPRREALASAAFKPLRHEKQRVRVQLPNQMSRDDNRGHIHSGTTMPVKTKTQPLNEHKII